MAPTQDGLVPVECVRVLRGGELGTDGLGGVAIFQHQILIGL